MSRCKQCNIEVLDETERCPLCHSVLEPTIEVENMYPDVKIKTRRMMLLSRIYLFVAIVAEAVLVCVPGGDHFSRCRNFDLDVCEPEELAELYYVADFYDFVQFCSDYSVSDRNYLCAVSGARGTRNVCIFVPWNADYRGQKSQGGTEEKIPYQIRKRQKFE